LKHTDYQYLDVDDAVVVSSLSGLSLKLVLVRIEDGGHMPLHYPRNKKNRK